MVAGEDVTGSIGTADGGQFTVHAAEPATVMPVPEDGAIAGAAGAAGGVVALPQVWVAARQTEGGGQSEGYVHEDGDHVQPALAVQNDWRSSQPWQSPGRAPDFGAHGFTPAGRYATLPHELLMVVVTGGMPLALDE